MTKKPLHERICRKWRGKKCQARMARINVESSSVPTIWDEKLADVKIWAWKCIVDRAKMEKREEDRSRSRVEYNDSQRNGEKVAFGESISLWPQLKMMLERVKKADEKCQISAIMRDFWHLIGREDARRNTVNRLEETARKVSRNAYAAGTVKQLYDCQERAINAKTEGEAIDLLRKGRLYLRGEVSVESRILNPKTPEEYWAAMSMPKVAIRRCWLGMV
jgi:hypothetical protein